MESAKQSERHSRAATSLTHL